MEIQVIRTDFTKLTSISDFLIKGIEKKWVGLEDCYRAPGEKDVMGDTCIPFGKYQLTLRREGLIYDEYKKRFTDIQNINGMLHIHNIAGVDYPYWYEDRGYKGVRAEDCVMIHVGNTYQDTKGCYLPGMKKMMDKVLDSTIAYKEIYKIVMPVLMKKEAVTIEYIDGRK